MRCANCGREFDDALAECPHCAGGAVSADWSAAMKAEVDGREKPFSSHLLLAILAFVFGFMPVGLVSVVYAVLAKSRFEADDREGALRNAVHARNWIIASFVTLVLIWVLIALVLLIGRLFLGSEMDRFLGRFASGR